MADGAGPQPSPKEAASSSWTHYLWELVRLAVIPATLAVIGYYATERLERVKMIDVNQRLYTELMNKREETESALRKDMFNSIIKSFFQENGKSGKPDLEGKVLELELLAYNFHESLNLKPLFTHLRKQILTPGSQAPKDLLPRMQRVATEITSRQLMILEEVGRKKDCEVDLASLAQKGYDEIEPFDLTLRDIPRNFRLVALKFDPEWKELSVRLEVRTLGQSAGEAVTASLRTAEFWVGFFDFPFIDNIRLSHDQRCALVLNALSDRTAQLTLVVFPGSYASLREKQFIHEVIQNLRRTQEDFLSRKNSPPKRAQ